MKLKLWEVMTNAEYLKIDEVQKILDDKKAIKDYAYILHNKDVYTDKDEAKNAEHKAGTHKADHYHIALRLDNAYSAKCVAEWFGLAENFVSKPTGKGNEAIKWCGMLKYLTHENAPHKHQYDESEVISNYAWADEKAKITNKSNSDARREEIINDIVSGKIRQYNYFEHITPIENDKYKLSIDNAFKYRLDKIKGGNRDMEVIYISGESQSGKTTYAKMLCEEKGYSFYVSSQGKNMFDDYAGHDVIILDDLRAEDLNVSGILKILDNNTSSQVGARFYNKVLECKLIIITSTLSIDDFFKALQQSTKEDDVQFKRRCKVNFHMTKDKMYTRGWLEKSKKYSNWYEYPNPVPFVLNQQDKTEEEMLDFIGGFLTADLKAVEAIKADLKTDKPKSNAPKYDKEQMLQTKIDMLQNHNDLLMNELDKRG